MIEHVVLFKLQPELDPERIEWMLRETRIRLLKMPVVRGLRCGHRVDRETEWPFFLLVELDSVEKLGSFTRDREHVRFLDEVIRPHVTDRLTLDYQSDPGGDPLLA